MVPHVSLCSTSVAWPGASCLTGRFMRCDTLLNVRCVRCAQAASGGCVGAPVLAWLLQKAQEYPTVDLGEFVDETDRPIREGEPNMQPRLLKWLEERCGYKFSVGHDSEEHGSSASSDEEGSSASSG